MFARFGEASCDVNIKNGGKMWRQREGVWRKREGVWRKNDIVAKKQHLWRKCEKRWRKRKKTCGDATTPTGCQVVSADPWFSGSRPTQRRRKRAAGDCSLEALDSLEEENKMLKRAIQYQAGTAAAAHAREKRLHHRNSLLEERVKTAVSAREALRRRCARMLSTDHIVMGGRP